MSECKYKPTLSGENSPTKKFRLHQRRRSSQSSPSNQNRLAPIVINDYDVPRNGLGQLLYERIFRIEREVRNLRQFEIARLISGIVRGCQIWRQSHTSSRIVVISRVGLCAVAASIVMLGTLNLAKRTIIWKPTDNITVMMMRQYRCSHQYRHRHHSHYCRYKSFQTQNYPFFQCVTPLLYPCKVRDFFSKYSHYH